MKEKIFDYLIFKLGSDYEEYEFDLIPIPPYEFIENELSLEPYEYFGEVKEVLGCKVQQIILYYNADNLMRVMIKFRGNKLLLIKRVLEESNINFPDTIMFLKMYFSPEIKETILLYQHKKLSTEF
ncbi:hypothetical protein [Chryseobacterium sp.]|uniref:hypothetical protein n=1 Tax=Chryseobacterium sp. TaxID=1871047 RepID=UPI0012A9B27E|nr:hypothetical protein [Chryseobacterium sp.]QFG52036.1 hypothetical protein F7R58_00105 [Chryseobacterium sp.]